MIFKLDGGVREVLALTPVLRVWNQRWPDKPVFVETLEYEVLKNNPLIDEASDYVSDEQARIIDLNFVEWQRECVHVTERYANAVLEIKTLENWRVVMTHEKEDDDRAVELMKGMGGKVAVVGKAWATQSDEERTALLGVLEECGYTPYEATRESCGSWQVFRAVVSLAQLYVGYDGDDSAVALTTDVRAIVRYSYINPAYFAPFRRGIPYVPVTVPLEVCSEAAVCLEKNGRCEFCKIYGIKCTMSSGARPCETWNWTEHVRAAIEKIRLSG